jgi:hypothetical protein
MSRATVVPAALFVLASVVWPAVATAGSYRFDALGQFSGAPRLGSVPAVNDNGTVAFVLPGTDGGFTLHTGVPGDVRAVPTPGVTTNFGGVSINNHGRIAFVAYADTAPTYFFSDLSVHTVDPGSPAQMVIPRGGTYGGEFQINTGIGDDGKVVASTYALNAPPDRLVLWDGTAATVVYQTLNFLYDVRMSTDGAYGVYENGFEVGPFQRWVTSRGAVDSSWSYTRPGTNDRVPFRNIGGGDVAANGWSVFSASSTDPAEPSSLFLWRGGSIQPVGSESLAGAPAINDSGVVAVLTTGSAAAPTRLVVLKDGVVTPVIAVGEELFGSTVSEIQFEPKGFNNAEQFAFLARLADGRNVVALASPVPEPGAACVLFVFAGSLLPRRRGHTHRC